MSEQAWPMAIDDFINHLAYVRHLSPHTLKHYRRDLQALAASCCAQQLTPPIVDSSHVRQWIAARHRQGLAPTSLRRALSAVRSFYTYRSRHGAKHNPALGITAPKGKQLLPKGLDVDSVQHFLAIPADTWLGKRDRALLELLYACGLRLAELVSLNIADIDRPDASLVVVGKGRRTRHLPVGRYALDALATWLSVRDQVPSNSQALFISKRGTRLAPRSIQARLSHYSRQQGMGQAIHPHQLRHAFASHILESSGNLRAVQELLGHANLSTTQIYTHLDFQHLAEVYDKTHPRAHKP